MASQPLWRLLARVEKRVSGTATKQDILVKVGQVIRARRVELGLSQEALAHASGIDRSHMGKIERGERNVTILNVQRVATALGTLPSALLGEAGH